MTIALTTTPAPTASAGPARAGFRQAVAAEWTKLFTLRSTKWILAITVAGTLLDLPVDAERHPQGSHVVPGF